MKILRALFLSLAIYGLLGWVYIAIVAVAQPWTLPWPLTHFLPWPREDTFGAFSFLISMISFFFWNFLKTD